MRIGVFTHNRAAARAFIDRYELRSIHKVALKGYCWNSLDISFANGDIVQWIRPVEMSRGYKVDMAYVNEDVTPEELDNIVLPCCVFCKPEDIIIGNLEEIEP